MAEVCDETEASTVRFLECIFNLRLDLLLWDMEADKFMDDFVDFLGIS